jgi:hypothetical protein
MATDHIDTLLRELTRLHLLGQIDDGAYIRQSLALCEQAAQAQAEDLFVAEVDHTASAVDYLG